MRGVQRKTSLVLRHLDALKSVTGLHVEVPIATRAVQDGHLISPGPAQSQAPAALLSNKDKRSSLAMLSMAAGLAVLGLSQSQDFSTVAHADAAADSSNSKVEDEDEKYRRVRQKRGLPKDVILYQYEVCPFCNKVRAFLDYHNVPYRVVEVNPLTKGQIKWSSYKKVPVVMLDEEVVNDSSIILSRLACEFEAAESSEPKEMGWFSRAKEVATSSGSQDEEEEIKWRKWVDTTFVQLITVNIYRSAKESWQTFDYITSHGNFSFFERQAARVSGSGLMYVISGKLIKKYGITGDLRESLYAAANEWVDNLGDKPFRGGSSPDLSDLSLFGVIRSVTGTDTFQDLMHQSKISGWYERMMAEVGSSSRLTDKA